MCFRPPEASMEKKCPACGENNEILATKCAKCGADLPDAMEMGGIGAPLAPPMSAPGAPVPPPVAPPAGAPKPPTS